MSQQVSCPNCGSPVAFGVRFCGNCGTGLNWPTQQQMPPEPAYQQPQQKQYAESQQQFKTNRQSDLRSRLYKMITKAEPEILWQAEGLKQRLDRKKLEKQLTKEIRVRLAYHWDHYDKLDVPQLKALEDYITTQERKMKLVDLLWEEEYRHGDHILIYNAIDGAFKQKVLTKFDGEPPSVILTPGQLPEWEYAHHVKPEDRTQLNTQPDFTSYETGWLIKVK